MFGVLVMVLGRTGDDLGQIGVVWIAGGSGPGGESILQSSCTFVRATFADASATLGSS